MPYHIPLESESDILVTSHGKRSITGVETGLDINTVTQSQSQAIPGIGEKTAWRIISQRAKKMSKGQEFGFDEAFEGLEIPEAAHSVF